MKFTKEWFMAALERALRTGAQIALGMITVGKTMTDIEWKEVFSVVLVSMIYSFLMSMVGKLPELEKPDLTPDGSLVIDESDPDAYGVFMNFGNKTVEDIINKDKVILEIKNGPVPDDEPKE